MHGHRIGLAVLFGLTTALAQDPPTPVSPQEPEHARALRTWIESDHTDRKQLDATAAALLDAREPGLLALQRELVALKPGERDRRIAVETLLSTTVLAALERELARGMRYAGQYDHLRALQPHAGNFLLNLVLQTPSWFPSDQRAQVVPALRDLFPEPPAEATIRRLVEMAKDEEFESEDLREALSLALAQWGHRDLVQKRIDTFVESAGKGRTADELHFMRALGKLNYELREYPEAALWWSRFIDGTVALDSRVAAIDEYDAACSFALAKRVDDSLAALERCAALVAAGKVDSSAAITREMFEQDPDLNSVRAHERFAKAQAVAFEKQDPAGPKKDGSSR